MEQLTLFGVQSAPLMQKEAQKRKVVEPSPQKENIEFKIGHYMRTSYGEVLPVSVISKPQKIEIGSVIKQNKDHKDYRKKEYKDIYTITSKLHDGRYHYKSILTLSDFIVLQRQCMIDCIFKGDKICTRDAIGKMYTVTHKQVGKLKQKEVFKRSEYGDEYKTYVPYSTTKIFATDGTKECVFTSDDVYGVIAQRLDYSLYLNVGDYVQDHYHGWSVIIRMYSNKCYCKNENFKQPYFIHFHQILDTCYP